MDARDRPQVLRHLPDSERDGLAFGFERSQDSDRASGVTREPRLRRLKDVVAGDVGRRAFDGLEREERLSASIDAVRERFGENAITRARLLTDRPRRRFDFGERPNKAGPAREADEVDK